MESKELFEKRVSMKSYTDELLPAATLDAIVEAAAYAPSGMDKQAAAYVIVNEEALRNELSALNAGIMAKAHPGYAADPFYGAKQLIIVLADKSVPTYLYDGSVAAANVLLAAKAYDADSCWIHRAKEVFETPRGKELLEKWQIPGYEGVAFCIVGKGAAEKKHSPRKSKVIHA
jgi:nitroreductase